MSTTQDSTSKRNEAGEEAQYPRQKEHDQLKSLNAQSEAEPPSSVPREDRDYEAGFGGQEDLEDRYATTSGEH
ncbi:hypothetical protein BC826DRAFT_499993 [Russula brevipes]|nr:hypothetical protein BC826DRAFT_499993 [Russula brevipes]